ncbi:hypothetical protein FRC00_003186 [Tulasnella sp. 408]|nr:hypothetical protein FRC00_003186 [Tulasnella sp. 408]
MEENMTSASHSITTLSEATKDEYARVLSNLIELDFPTEVKKALDEARGRLQQVEWSTA